MNTHKILYGAFFGLLALATVCSACKGNIIMPSGKITKQTYTFNGVVDWHISSLFDVELIPSGQDSVVIEIDENLMPYVSIRQEEDEVYIGTRENGITLKNIRKSSAPFKAKIYYTHLEEVEVSGASAVFWKDTILQKNLAFHLSGASSAKGALKVEEELEIHLSGASEMSGSWVVMGEADLSASGASSFDVKGDVYQMDVELSGASTINSFGLKVRDLRLDMSGASEGKLTVSEFLKMELSGSSSFTYKGKPHISMSKISGVSDVKNKAD